MFDLSFHFKTYPGISVIHTTPYHEQSKEISQPVTTRPDPIPKMNGKEHIVEKILDHRKRGKRH